jgi:hypothetical protein
MLPKEIVFTIRPRDLGRILLVSPLAVLIAWWIFNWPWESPNAPAWVQAVGSIAAILVSVWIANAKDRRDEKKAKEKLDLVESAVSQTAASMHHFATDFFDCLQNLGRLGAVDWDRKHRVFGTYYAQLDKFSPFDFPDNQMAIAYRCLWGAVRDAHSDTTPLESDRLNENFLPKIRNRCKGIIEASNFWFKTVEFDSGAEKWSTTSPSSSTGESDSRSRGVTSH